RQTDPFASQERFEPRHLDVTSIAAVFSIEIDHRPRQLMPEGKRLTNLWQGGVSSRDARGGAGQYKIVLHVHDDQRLRVARHRCYLLAASSSEAASCKNAEARKT